MIGKTGIKWSHQDLLDTKEHIYCYTFYYKDDDTFWVDVAGLLPTTRNKFKEIYRINKIKTEAEFKKSCDRYIKDHQEFIKEK